MRTEPLRFLMVDDDPDDFLLVRQILRAGVPEATLVHAPSASQAIRLLALETFDLVLLDYRLGSTSGLELLSALGEGAIPVVMLTGEGDEEVAAEALKRGARDYLVKSRLTEQGLAKSITYALELRRHERQLEESRRDLATREERFRALVENSCDCVALLSPDLRWQYVSQSVERHFGYRPEELVGEEALARVHPEDRPAMREALTQVGRTAAVPVAIQGRVQDIQGRFRHVEGVAVNRLGEHAVRALVLNFRDVTERRALQEQLAQAQKMEAVGKLAGGVAHDFNNLLLVVSSYAELLRDGAGSDPRLQRYADEIIKAAKRAAGLTRQLLAFSRKQEMAPVLLDLGAALRDLGGMLSRVLGENIEVVITTAPDLWRVRIDPVQLEQAVVNLCVNAREAMPHGGRLSLHAANVSLRDSDPSFEPPLPAGEYINLLVRDTGKGIAPQDLPRIFEPFFSTKEEGSGLGLPTVYGIVQQSGGAIAVRSELGAGTEFDIFLPRASAGQPARIPAETPAARPHGGETILLVEDDEAVRESATEFLSDRGYTIVQAKNGAEALDLVNRFPGPIHMVVSDVIMPVMSGPELARRLATVRPALRVLFISGYTENMFAQYGLTQEALLQKPFTLSALGERIRQTLDAAWAGPVGAPVSV